MHKAIINGFFLLLTGSLFLGTLNSCQHSPVMNDDDGVMPIDTSKTDTTVIEPIDTSSIDIPCEPDIIYFDLDILPILRSNCAFSGCHDPASAEDGVILISYESVIETADVEAFNLDDSELYEVLVHTDENERMPPAPTPKLAAEQIQKIAKWILQGATYEVCNPDLSLCDTIGVSFSEFVHPNIRNYCQGCHSGNVPAGGIDLSQYNGVETVAKNGRLYGAIAWLEQYEHMPKGGEQLPNCTINKIKSWVDDGAPNN